MLVLGITGGVGSGKSTAAKLLVDRGARLLDADAIVHDLYREGELPRRIAERFGEDALRSDGSVDRRRLGAIVFGDPTRRGELEAIVHPAVRARVAESLEEWRREGFRGVAVVDAALLVEAVPAYPLDALVVVVAPEDLRLARLEARGMRAEEARRRMRAQTSDAEKSRSADFILTNDGSFEILGVRLGEILTALGRDRPGSFG